MSMGAFCNREVVVATRKESIREAASLMREYHVGTLVIVEDRKGLTIPVGLLTDRDIVVELLAKNVDPDAVVVGDVMSPELVTADEHEDVSDVVKRMRAKGIRRMPVIGDNGALVGLFAADDVLELLAEQLSDLSHLVGRERQHEATVRP